MTQHDETGSRSRMIVLSNLEGCRLMSREEEVVVVEVVDLCEVACVVDCWILYTSKIGSPKNRKRNLSFGNDETSNSMEP